MSEMTSPASTATPVTASVSSSSAGKLWPFLAPALAAILHAIAFPPFDVAEAGFVFAVPALLWAWRAPRPRLFAGAMFGSSWMSWLIILEWLRHVTWAGTIALAAVLALFPTLWFVAARAVLPRAIERSAPRRIAVTLGLAGAWVLLEWLRSWILTGFPWLPLAASQWERPVMLQSAAYGGAWAVSFVLILFNLGLASYLERIVRSARAGVRRISPEFYVAMAVLLFASFGMFRVVTRQQREPLLRAGVMQPYIPQAVKWDPAHAPEILKVLERQTMLVKDLGPDAVFWPEAVTPLGLGEEFEQLAWIERLVRMFGRPIVFGSVDFVPAAGARIAPGEPISGEWFNGILIAEPERGVTESNYHKRHLVPFGEYVPLRRFIPFVEKFVPIGGEFRPGRNAAPLPLALPDGRTIRVGALVCYEDIFPELARSSVAAGAELLFVATNNAWYGETGAAYQHAAHAVLRAVETRRPVLRSGNGGWSGWIDEYGVVRDVLLDERGSIYHRGGGVFEITRDQRWIGRDSVYLKTGDWMIAVCAVLTALGAAAVWRSGRKPAT